jgi:hypothetical protein
VVVSIDLADGRYFLKKSGAFRSFARLDRNHCAETRDREADMSNIERMQDEDLAFGLADNEIKATAGRQLVASLAVGLVIAAAAGLMALGPGRHDNSEPVQHKFALVRQPTFVTPPGQRVASAKRYEIELP